VSRIFSYHLGVGIFLFFFAGQLAVQAAEEGDVASRNTFTFQTQGIDRYADGTVVRDGEKYALVFARKQSVFSGFFTSGQLVDPTNNVLLFCSGVAKGGCCPETEVIVEDGQIESTGSLYVIMLDTRAPDGSIGGYNLMSGYGVAGQVKNANTRKLLPGKGGITGNNPDGSTQIDQSTQLPSDIPPPIITSFRIENGQAFVRFKNSRSDIYYALGNKKHGQSWVVPAFNTYRRGGVKLQDEAEMVFPAEGDAGFFKIVVPTNTQVGARVQSK
jgi:hypothetical protein